MKTKTIILLLSILGLLRSAHAINVEEARWKIRELTRSSELGKAIALSTQALAELPEDPDLLILHGTILMNNCEAAKAIPFLERASRLVPQSGRARGHTKVFIRLAEAHFQLGNYDEASNCFSIAQKHPDDFSYLDNTIAKFGLSTAYKSWILAETAHIRFHFSPNLPPESRRHFTKTREAAFVDVNGFFNASLPKKIDYFVWSSLEEAQQIANITNLGFANSAPSIIHSRANQSRGHEITHVLTRHAFRPVQTVRFINEGIAVCFDLSKADRIQVARDAVRATKSAPVSIIALWNETPGKTAENPFYPVAGAFIECLRQKGGDDKLRLLCADQSHDAAIQIYGDDLDRWIVEFENEINSK